MFDSANNHRPLRRDEYRVWRFGESRVVRSLEHAHSLLVRAQILDSGAHAVDANGERV